MGTDVDDLNGRLGDAPKISIEVEDAKVPWRILTDQDGCFDELVLGHCLHLERMDEYRWWLGIEHPNGGRYSFFFTFEQGGAINELAVSETPEDDEGGQVHAQ